MTASRFAPMALVAQACCLLPALLSVAGSLAFAATQNPGPERDQAKQALDAAGVKGGLIVHLGCGDGKLTAALRANDSYLVHGLDADVANIEKARANIRAAGIYGPVSVSYWPDKTRLPYADNLVNLVVAEDLGAVPWPGEVMRVLAPLGVALLGGKKTVKPWPKEIDEWTHFLHGPDNNAVARDRVVGPPRSIQWASEPRWGRSHEELASMSASVTAQGRIFSIFDQAPLASIRFTGQWELVAQDAFNGTQLWKKPIPKWTDHLRHFRAGPVHLPRRLVAVGDTVYVTLGLDAPVTALDAATGEVLRVYAGTEYAEEILAADGMLYLAVGTSESERVGLGLSARNEPEASRFRFIAAVRADSGELFWKKEFTRNEQLLPLTLTVAGQSVFYQSTLKVARLDARSGQELWKAPRQTAAKRMSFSAPTVVAAVDVLLVADRTPSNKDAPSVGTLAWAVHGWDEPGFSRKAKSTVQAYSIESGKELWSAECSEGYNSPVDLFVVGDTVWVGGDFKGYDLKTGVLKKPLVWKGDKVGMTHHRCYRDKATENYLLAGRSGIEMVSFETGWRGNNSWIRGTCQYGIMPANGLLYAPPNACACFSEVKLQGFFAAAPQRPLTLPSPRGGEGGVRGMPLTDEPALEKGPRYGKAAPLTPTLSPPGRGQGEGAAADWPMYRHDEMRSGVVTTVLPASLKKRWTAGLKGVLTQPIACGGRVYVASADEHTVYALNADDGKMLWSHTAGGRIDSAPTFHKGLLLLGSADGQVTCLDAVDGGLVWRFRAAPKDLRVVSFGQLESVWPVHGSVLVQNDALYVTAGRSTYLDGGIILYRLDLLTGKELSRNVSFNLDPETGKQTGVEPTGPFNMEGATSDILSGDGDSVFMKHLRFDAACKPAAADKPHLFSMTRLLGEEWFVRSYWLLGTQVGAGWGGWANAAKSVPFGRILCFDQKRVWGYGRKTISSGATGHKADAYHLFCKTWSAAAAAPAAEPGKKGAGKKGAKEKAAPAPTEVWSVESSPIVRAMVLASDKLVIAGPPDVGQKDSKLLAYLNEAEALAAFNGKEGALLQVLSAVDGKGKRLSEQNLTSMPVFDGMSAANGRLYVSLKDGTVECWGE